MKFLKHRVMRVAASDGCSCSCNPKEFTIRTLAETVLELTGSRSKLVYKPLPSDDPVRRQPDISLARKALGWEPLIQLLEVLQQTIDYFERQLSVQGRRPLSTLASQEDRTTRAVEMEAS